MLKRIIGALLLCAGLVVAMGASPASARTPSGQACRTIYYSDGVAALKLCLYYADSTSSTWKVDDRLVWNIPAPSTSPGGYGHLEDFSNNVRWVQPLNTLCSSNTLTDGNTCFSGTLVYQNDGQTVWAQVDKSGLPGSWTNGTGRYCKRVFFNEGGGTSETNSCS